MSQGLASTSGMGRCKDHFPITEALWHTVAGHLGAGGWSACGGINLDTIHDFDHARRSLDSSDDGLLRLRRRHNSADTDDTVVDVEVNRHFNAGRGVDAELH